MWGLRRSSGSLDLMRSQKEAAPNQRGLTKRLIAALFVDNLRETAWWDSSFSPE